MFCCKGIRLGVSLFCKEQHLKHCGQLKITWRLILALTWKQSHTYKDSMELEIWSERILQTTWEEEEHFFKKCKLKLSVTPADSLYLHCRVPCGLYQSRLPSHSGARCVWWFGVGFAILVVDPHQLYSTAGGCPKKRRDHQRSHHPDNN